MSGKGWGELCWIGFPLKQTVPQAGGGTDRGVAEGLFDEKCFFLIWISGTRGFGSNYNRN